MSKANKDILLESNPDKPDHKFTVVKSATQMRKRKLHVDNDDGCKINKANKDIPESNQDNPDYNKFTIVESATQRGNRKLVDDEGYTYTVKVRDALYLYKYF